MHVLTKVIPIEGCLHCLPVKWQNELLLLSLPTLPCFTLTNEELFLTEWENTFKHISLGNTSGKESLDCGKPWMQDGGVYSLLSQELGPQKATHHAFNKIYDALSMCTHLRSLDWTGVDTRWALIGLLHHSS